MTKPNASGRTALYRFYAADDALLYVGITNRLSRRWEDHAKQKPWWPLVDHQTVHWQPTREAAEAAETNAIATERPVYNIKGSPWEACIIDDGASFHVIPKPTFHSERFAAIPDRRRLWPYEKVAAAIEARIRSGDYAPGTPLPSQDLIASEERVSKHTVSAAVRLLRGKGILSTRPRLGTFPAPPPDG